MKGINKMTEESKVIRPKEESNIKGGLFSKLNKQNVFDIDTKSYKWVNLKTLYDTDPSKKYKLQGVFTTNKSKFGTEPVAIINGFLVNLPRHLLDDVQGILDNDDMIEAIKQGHAGFEIYSYHSTTYNKDAFSINWLDM